MQVTVCSNNRHDRDALMGLIRLYHDARGLPLRLRSCQEWGELYHLLKEDRHEVVVVAIDGVEGMETAISARPLAGKLVWISDLDFGVQSYRMRVTYFCMKPMTLQKMERALDRCAGEIDYPPGRTG